MNPRTTSDQKKPRCVLLLGSGGLKIGQAGEFDYSGSQAIKALKEEGIRVILVNPNVATVQTNTDLADRVYFVPVMTNFVAEVIRKERPDGLLLGFGGQTALNVGLDLDAQGILRKYRVRVLGTSVTTIRDTEDRHLFVQRLREIHVHVARSQTVTSLEEAYIVAQDIGYPLMLRAGFTLGGKGSGKISNHDELKKRLEEILTSVPQVLLEEYLGGWKEIEYEVVRDIDDNCITVCNMENVDPMGIHTGESIVVAPSQTLSNAEYHGLRSVSQRTVRHLGIVGECNIQFALHPTTGEYRVIEVNARLSRSSALASKATGYPLAWVAAKLALGYNLTEIANNVTKITQACFEPALDYVVVKMPRWDLNKFYAADRRIGSEMKSVGEVMAIGRSFEEALQKATRMLNIGVEGVYDPRQTFPDMQKEIHGPTDRRLFALAHAMMQGETLEELHEQTKIDFWFLHRIAAIVTTVKKLQKKKMTTTLLRRAKEQGFGDAQIASIRKTTEEQIRVTRMRWKIFPVVKQIDTLAGEFPAQTNYLYMTYNGREHDIARSQRKPIIVLGGGAYRIGSSVEFDWCAVQAVQTIAAKGESAVMINCNPETVSTDYDICDRLYFEELTLERIRDICAFEHVRGVVVSMGGQIPNTLAPELHRVHIPIFGTSPEDIDRAENRHTFAMLCDELGIEQPAWRELTTIDAAQEFAAMVEYPVLVRPSYVLSGSAMNIAYNKEALAQCLKEAAHVSDKYPVVISKFIEGSREVEIDGVGQNGELVIYALTEHIENAGVHSGDATVVLPPQKTYIETMRRIKKRTRALVRALHITGPFNIQFLAKGNELKIIELNLRASRSFPFVSKATKYNFAALATATMLGDDIRGEYNTLDFDYVVVKAPQFSYARIKGADPVLYVEMGSTGEVACFGDGAGEALLKAMCAADMTLPKKNILLSIGRDENKIKLTPAIQQLYEMGFTLFATQHTAAYIKSLDIPVTRLYKVSERKSPNVSEYLAQGKLDFIINIPQSYTKSSVTDGYVIRRMAIDHNVTLLSNTQLAIAIIQALAEMTHKHRVLQVKAWDEYSKSNSH